MKTVSRKYTLKREQLTEELMGKQGVLSAELISPLRLSAPAGCCIHFIRKSLRVGVSLAAVGAWAAGETTPLLLSALHSSRMEGQPVLSPASHSPCHGNPAPLAPCSLTLSLLPIPIPPPPQSLGLCSWLFHPALLF